MRLAQCVGLVALFVTALTVASVSAEPTEPPKDRAWLRQSAPAARANPSVARPSYGMWVAVSILVGGAGFALWQRRRTRQPSAIGAIAQIKVEGITRLSQKAQLVVVKVDGRNLLLGVTDMSVSRLAWLDGSEETELEQDFDEPAPRRQGDIAQGELYPRRAASPSAALRTPNQALSAKVSPPPTTSQRKSSRFRDILADAVGLGSKAPTKHSRNLAPVDELVPRTEDRYVGRSISRHQTEAGAQGSSQPSALINIEGQAAGLVARLHRSEP